MAEHSTLTGSSLHEPKGVASASSHQVYISDGFGSGVWSDFGGSFHGQMEAVGNTTTIALTAATLTTISDYIRITGIWAAPAESTNHGITFDVDKLTVPVKGTYKLEFWASFTTPNSSETGFKFGINQPATSPITLSSNTLKRTSGASADYGVAAAFQIVDLEANDEISLYVASDTTGNLLLEDSVVLLQLVHVDLGA